MTGHTIIASSAYHKLPSDMRVVLLSKEQLLTKWNDLTPIQRNEWICWVTNVKLTATRAKHIVRLKSDLLAGKKQPCCWPGCPHRRPEARKWFRPAK